MSHALQALQLLGYPLVVWLIWVWFGIAERNLLDLLLSVVVGVLIVAILGWLLASAFYGTVVVHRRLRRAFFLSFILIVLILCALLVPRRPEVWYPVLIWSMAGILGAAAVPPILFGTAWPLFNWRYWAGFLALAAGTVGLPWLLLNWIPKLDSVTLQTVSMVIRFTLAYAIWLASLLGFAWFVRRMTEAPIVPTRAA